MFCSEMLLQGSGVINRSGKSSNCEISEVFWEAWSKVFLQPQQHGVFYLQHNIVIGNFSTVNFVLIAFFKHKRTKRCCEQKLI